MQDCAQCALEKLSSLLSKEFELRQAGISLFVWLVSGLFTVVLQHFFTPG